MKQLLLSTVIGLVGTGIAISVILWGGQLVASAQVATSDFFMVRAHGLRLGARPANPDILLVQFDRKSAEKLGYVHSFPSDVELYKKLLDQGAKIVFDTRMVAVASADAFVEFRPLLDGMVRLDSKGRLLRDVWMSSELHAEHGEAYGDLLVQNTVNSHPHVIPSVGSRLYPLTYWDANGMHESAPLVIVRQFRGEPRATPLEVGAELGRSGVMSKWHELAPQSVPKTDVARSPFRFGSHEIDWHPFLSSSMLIPPAAFWVSYEPKMSDFARLSYVDVLRGKELSEVKGKIVLVGYEADIDPTSDTYTVPNMLGKSAADEVVACATQTLLENRNFREVPRWASLLIAAVLILAITIVAGIARPIQAVLGTLALLMVYFILAVIAYRVGWYSDFLVAPVAATLTAIPAGAASAWLSLRARQRVVDLFGRYVPRAIVNQLIQRPELESLTIGGVEREVTVMFADIRGFTNFSQDMSPEEVVKQLNSLLEVMVECTFENEGTLDKFIGDAILVLFNAPLDQKDHSQRAVQTAISIQKRLRGHASGLHVGIGIHRGKAVVGNIGTPKRMEYTAIGSTVNIASRLCDLALPGDVVVTDSVLEHLSQETQHHAENTVTVKGIDVPLQVAKITI